MASHLDNLGFHPTQDQCPVLLQELPAAHPEGFRPIADPFDLVSRDSVDQAHLDLSASVCQ